MAFEGFYLFRFFRVLRVARAVEEADRFERGLALVVPDATVFGCFDRGSFAATSS
jgi:hypothetical protein